jgi:hypothetical protein
MPVLRAFSFSVKLQCDNLVSHSGVGEYKKRTCVIPFKKCIKSSTIKSDKTVLHQQKITKKSLFPSGFGGIWCFHSGGFMHGQSFIALIIIVGQKEIGFNSSRSDR